MSGRWEIEPRYGLQQLARFWGQGEQVARRRSDNSGPLLRALSLSTSGSVIAGAASDTLEGKGKLNRIAHLTMSGPMTLDGGACDYGVRDTIQLMRQADAGDYSAILLEIDSGGGESTAGTELQNAIRDTTKPVVVYTQMLASAALRASLPATAIYAAHTSADIGSIGSYISFDRELLGKIQERIGYIYAEQSTEKNADFMALLDGNEEPLRQYVTTGAQVFIDEVEAYRPNMTRTTEQAKSMQAGALFSAADAADMGLIDGVATLGQVAEALLSGHFLDHHQGHAAPRNQNHAGLSPANYTTTALATRRADSSTPMLNIFGSKKKEEQAKEPTMPEPTTPTVEVDETSTTVVDRLDALEAALTQNSATIVEQAATIAEQAATVVELRENLTTAKASVSTLEQKLADVKVGNAPAIGRNKPANRAQFATADRVDESTSKY